MKKEEPNIIIDNVLSQEEIDRVYSAVETSTSKPYLMHYFSQVVTDFHLPDDIANKIVRLAEEISGIPNLKIEAHQFARYKNYKTEFENLEPEDTKPLLSPHWDDAFETPRLTFDYQIGGNTTWGITVEGADYVLENNQALTFGGTHQIHWRPHKLFSDDDYIDMIFIHLDQIGAEKIETRDPEREAAMDAWGQVYIDSAPGGLTNFYGKAFNVQDLEVRYENKGIVYGAATNNN